jgi:hypothetical protein
LAQDLAEKGKTKFGFPLFPSPYANWTEDAVGAAHSPSALLEDRKDLTMVYLNVRYSSQLPGRSGGTSFNDSTGCWLHSISMMLSYFGRQLRIGLPELYAPGLSAGARSSIQSATGGSLPRGHFATGSAGARAALAEAMRIAIQSATGAATPPSVPTGFQLDEHQLLVDREGLEAVPQCAIGHYYTAAELEQLLRSGGPVVFY